MEAARPLKFALFLLGFGLAACTPAISPQDVNTTAPAPSAATDTAKPAPTITLQPAATASPQPAAPTKLPTRTPILLPSPSVTPTRLPCWEAGGAIQTHLFYAEDTPQPWELRVYTPPCYEQQTGRRYPLLILIHGSTFTDDQWDRLGADETADALIASGALSPFLILMPRDRVWVDPLQDPFGDALIEDILPWVDENYRTLPERENRAIGGLSRGASWAVHLGLSHWELFGAIGGHSLPVFASDPPRIQRWLDEIPADSMPRIFLDIGEKDYLREKAEWFENLLTVKGIPHEWYLYNGRHEEAYWQAHLEQYLRWYAQEW